MARLRVGVFGAGLIAQVEHVPNLLHLHDKFDLVRVADPSASARQFMAERFAIATCETLDQLLNEPLDALLIAAPDFTHREATLTALAAGLHVFCEKPLCYAPGEAAALARARDRAGRVLQVGYMKRFDPAFAAALAALPGDGQRLRYVAVEVNEPDAVYQTAHHATCRIADLPAALIEAGREETRRQVAAALGGPVDALTFQGFITAFCSSLVHDVNLVHGLLEPFAIDDLQVIGAEVFAGGDGGAGTVRLNGGRSLWQMVHVMVPHLAEYRERVSLYFDDMALELLFPSPYLDHQPTRLVIHRSSGHRYERVSVRSGYEGAYVRELEGFWAAIVTGAGVRNTAEQAARDQTLLCALGRAAARHRSLS